MPGSVPVSPQDSSRQRTAWLALRARAASWAVLDEDALLADGSFVRPLGMGAGSAIRPPQGDSAVLSTALEASPCCPWELEGSMALKFGGGRRISNPHVCSSVPAYAFHMYVLQSLHESFHDSDAKKMRKGTVLQEVRGNALGCKSLAQG